MSKKPLTGRQWAAQPAKRERVPLLIGLMGPSGGGKTFSALRLASGIQSVVGGKIGFIDTENRRALHYADRFTFEHIPFDPPFGSLDYLAAIRWAVAQGYKTVVVDSMSHEHEGEGGMVALHDELLEKMIRGDESKREKLNMLAWAEPKARRRQLINGILRLGNDVNLICCFRAKNVVKPVRKGGKTEVEPQGFVPIAGDELVFEMTLNALLLPHANGIPTWTSEYVGEKTMMKKPEQFRDLLDRPRQFDERLGADLARWALGDAAPPASSSTPSTRQAPPPESKPRRTLADALAGEARKGSAALTAAWAQLNERQVEAMRSFKDEFDEIAREEDERQAAELLRDAGEDDQDPGGFPDDGWPGPDVEARA